MPRQYTPRIECACQNCGGLFAVPAYRADSAKFCSAACHYAGRTAALADAFWQKVEKTESCWLWRASLNTQTGYGQLTHQSVHYASHRLSYEIVAGVIPDGLMVLHTCDNPSCVRNDDEGWYEMGGVLLPRRGHLFLGTQMDNMRDKAAKERSATGDKHGRATHPERTARGERQGSAKLTEEQVSEIRRRYDRGGESQYKLANAFGVSRPTIAKITSGQTWRLGALPTN